MSMQENAQRVILDAKREKREAAKKIADEEKRKKRIAKGGTGEVAGGKVGQPPPIIEENGCIMDNLLKEIRSGTSLKSTGRKGTIRRKSTLSTADLKKLKSMVSKEATPPRGSRGPSAEREMSMNLLPPSSLHNLTPPDTPISADGNNTIAAAPQHTTPTELKNTITTNSHLDVTEMPHHDTQTTSSTHHNDNNTTPTTDQNQPSLSTDNSPTSKQPSIMLPNHSPTVETTPTSENHTPKQVSQQPVAVAAGTGGLVAVGEKPNNMLKTPAYVGPQMSRVLSPITEAESSTMSSSNDATVSGGVCVCSCCSLVFPLICVEGAPWIVM